MRPPGDPPPFAAKGDLEAARIAANNQSMHNAVLLNGNAANAATLNKLGVN
jgi:hypothetical protein